MTHSCALRPAAQACDSVYSLNLGSEPVLIHPIESNLKLGSEPTLTLIPPVELNLNIGSESILIPTIELLLKPRIQTWLILLLNFKQNRKTMDCGGVYPPPTK